MYNYKVANLVRVIDGDTIDLNIDLGFQVFKVVRCRLARVNAPELSTPEGKRFKQMVIDKLTANPPIEIDSTKYDKYGRSIAEVYLKNDISLSSFLIANGCPIYI